MKIDHFILARSSSVDEQSNTISVFEILDEITLKQAKPSIAIVHFLVVFVREAEVGKVTLKNIRFTVLSEKTGETVALTIDKLEIIDRLKRMRVRGLISLPFEETGRYRIKVVTTHDGKEISRECSLDVTISP